MLPETEKLIESARGWYRRGHLVPADLQIREALEIEPEHPGAHHLLGEICLTLGLKKQAINAFEQALRCDAPRRSVSENLEIARQLPDQCEYSQPRYLLIKAWGHGFWSEVSHTLACLLLSEITARIPIVHWGRNCLFQNENDGDAFGLYFELLSNTTIDDLASVHTLTIFPDKWTTQNLRDEQLEKWEGRGSRLSGILYLNRPETLAVVDFNNSVIELLPWLPETHPMHGKLASEVVRYLAAKYLKPRMDILNDVQSFYAKHLAGQNTLAVHVRGSDKLFEVKNLESQNQQIIEFVDQQEPNVAIFLMTDDVRWLNIFRQRYGDRVIVTDCERTSNDVGTHNLPLGDGSRLGREMMLDTYLALECQSFIGNGLSNVAAMIAALKPWPTGACRLIAKAALRALTYGVHCVVEPTLITEKAFSSGQVSRTDATILALERIDTSTRPDLGFIDYRDTRDLGNSIQRIADALNSGEFYEAKMRIQIVYILHFGAVTAHVPYTVYLNVLLCIAELRLHTGEGYISLEDQITVLNDLVHPDQDAEMQERLDRLISLFDAGDLEQCEAELWKCLNECLPALAAPKSANIRTTVISISKKFRNPELSDLVQKIGMAVSDQRHANSRLQQ